MSEEAKTAKPKKHYIVHTKGGESLTIPAHDMYIDSSEDRIYFMDESDRVIEKWLVFLSGVAAIEITDPPTMGVGRLRR